MRSWIIQKCMKLIRETKSLNQTKLEEIEYGLTSIYILITKSIIIFGIAFILGVLKEFIIFMLVYNIIRMPSFGLHATKSWICLVSSILIFLSGLYISLLFQIPTYIKIILGIYCIIRIYQNAPADTYKRPIINKKRRRFYKTVSTFIAILYVSISLFIENSFLSNSLIYSLCIQIGMISPYIYQLFNLPYNNYKRYQLNNI